MSNPRTAYTAALNRRSTARSRKKEAAAAVLQSQQLVAETSARTAELERILEAATTRAAYEQATAALATVKLDHALAVKAEHANRSADTQAQSKLNDAEAQVQATAVRLDDALVAEKAKEFARIVLDQLPVLAAWIPPPEEASAQPNTERLPPLAAKVLALLHASLAVPRAEQTLRDARIAALIKSEPADNA